MNNRRNWIKEISLGTLGFTLGYYNTSGQTKSITHPKTTKPSTILLGLNENPYGPSPKAREAILESIKLSNRYGFKLTSELISLLSKKNNVTKSNILLGPGSTELLDLIFQFSSKNNGSYIIADNTFDYWTTTKNKEEFKRISIPLTNNKKHNLKAMLYGIKEDTKLIYICNPNNPTGTICKREKLVSFIEEASKKALVLIDEAYIDFTNEKSISSIAIANKNVVVTKTFSKLYGLAGARIGYAIGHENTIKQISKLKSWPNGNLSVLSVAAAIASLQDTSFLENVLSWNNSAKNYTAIELEKLGIKTIPSYTNFMYFSLLNYKKDYHKKLELNNIKGSRIYEENGKWSRITIGTMEEMQKYISALQ